jgi:hypothetical protein
MSPDRFFCSRASREHGEALYGTVAQVRSWILLEYPSVWRRRAIEDSRLLSERVKAYLQSAAERSILVRQEHQRSGEIRCFRIQCEPPARTTMRLLDDYEHLADSAFAESTVPGVLYATCTHGRHDMCCAKFGLPVACALRDTVGGRAWDCSHIGGDRFAGNVVVFPYGLYYGHVRPEDVPDLVAASEQGEVWLKGYRGRCIHPRHVQVAEYFARRESGRLGIEEFSLMQRSRNSVVFRAASDDSKHEVEFRTRPEPLHERLTCHATAPSDIPQYELVRYSFRK